MSETAVPYWDVFPSRVLLSGTESDGSVPLSIRGDCIENPVFESVDSSIAEIDVDGIVTGKALGQTMILVYSSPEKKSVRYVEVQVGTTVVSTGSTGNTGTTPEPAVWQSWEES